MHMQTKEGKGHSQIIITHMHVEHLSAVRQ